jgi:hypothetical protein
MTKMRRRRRRTVLRRRAAKADPLARNGPEAVGAPKVFGAAAYW